jgi:TPR repeat protein
MSKLLALMVVGISLAVPYAALADDAPPTTQEMAGYALSLATSAAAGDKSALATLRSNAALKDPGAEFGLGEYYVFIHLYPQSISWFQQSAAQDFAGGYYGLGVACDSGQGVAQDYAQAMHFYLKAIELPDAEMRIGGLYAEGHGVKQDRSQAAAWYRKAADGGSTEADLALGDAYQAGTGMTQDDAQAMHWYMAAADRGDATAEYRLGMLYEHSKSLQDYKQAAVWYRRASEQGVADAQLELGMLYSSGKGVPADPAKAVQQFQMAANQGDGQAQYQLGNSFAAGAGVPIDPVRAYQWMSIAQTSLDAKDPTSSLATAKLKGLEGQMSPTQIVQAKKAATEWLKARGIQQ